jgi:hypothetical protein
VKVQAKTNNPTGDLEAPAFEVVKDAYGDHSHGAGEGFFFFASSHLKQQPSCIPYILLIVLSVVFIRQATQQSYLVVHVSSKPYVVP